jgi:BlaI family transcriptional regulator, penicillinase repressor
MGQKRTWTLGRAAQPFLSGVLAVGWIAGNPPGPRLVLQVSPFELHRALQRSLTVTTSLTDLQLAIMRVLWDRGEATVLEVQERLRPERDLAQTTIATLLSRLEKRAVIAHRLDGRQFIYRPLVSEQDVRRSMVSELTALLFDGSSAALMSHLLRSREIEPGDLDRVKRMIADAERDTSAGAGGNRSGGDVR